MSKILFINACVREEKSRTLILARAFLETYARHNPQDIITERNLMRERLEPLYPQTLARQDALEQARKLDDPMFALAREFVSADKIILAAPFWGLSFPALLRIYLERVSVVNLTFGYDADGVSHGYCKGEKMLYLTTRGGDFSGEKAEQDMGMRQLEALCRSFGIGSFRCLSADGLDDRRFDAQAIMMDALARARQLAEEF